VVDDDHSAALIDRLDRPCWEVIPLKGVERQLDHLPSGATVAITCSPDKGIPATLDLAARITGRGFSLVPHVAARMVRDRTHLRDILRRLEDLEIDRLFVIGGDAEEPIGKYDSSLQLLLAMEVIEHGITEVGVGAYPEGHPLIDDATLLEFLEDKQPLAAYMVTQMCFDPEVIVRWLSEMRELGIRLPVKIGIPGVAARIKLLQIAVKIGVGQSARFLKTHLRLVGEMAKPGGYSPDELLLGLAPHLDDERLNISGFHIYTFNQLHTTDRWRSGMLSRLTA
jgi:methylenetetrahydrofolate reductase (NADPH)